LQFAEIDFRKDLLHDVLRNSGYEPSEKTFFIWEGVSMYLTEEAVRGTLRTISGHSGRASSLVMDFAEQAMIDLLNKFPHLSQHNYTTAWGEPWTFGLPDMLEREFFQECGFELREIVSFMSREASARYLTRSDGTKFGTVRGGPPQRGQFATVLGLIWMFLTRRSRWYALAKLDVG
jgi:methyltransferase (TIGR00027 family)